MPKVCKNCGNEFPDSWTGNCPNCGCSEFVEYGQNYTSTITVSSIMLSAFEHINSMRSSLAHLAAQLVDYRVLCNNIQPVIEGMQQVAKLIEQQKIAIASTQKRDLDEFESKIQEYRKLIEINAEEFEFQRFFEENPIFLDYRVIKSFPKKSLGGEGCPDFLLALYDSSYLVVEIEKPSVRLFNKKGDPTSKFTHAQQQIRNYLRWVKEEKEFLRKRGCENLGEDNTTGLIVIGKRVDLTPEELTKLKNINAEVRSRYLIKTFDDILEEAETLLKNLREGGNKT